MQDIQAIIWDLDHTLYEANETFIDNADMAMAYAAIHNGLDIGIIEAFEKSKKSYEETGQSMTHFLRDFPGADPVALHRDAHRVLDERFIEPFEDLPALFNSLSGVQHILATHGIQEWAERVLSFTCLDGHFDPEHMYDFNDMNYVKKSENEELFDRIVAKAEIDPTKMMMVEDSARNLKIAKERGMTTVLLTYGEERDDIPDYVDHVFNTAEDLMRHLLDQKNIPLPDIEPGTDFGTRDRTPKP